MTTSLDSSSMSLPSGCICVDTGIVRKNESECQYLDCGEDKQSHVSSGIQWCSSNTNQKPRIFIGYDYTAPANGVVELFYHTFHKLLCVEHDNSAFKGIFYYINHHKNQNIETNTMTPSFMRNTQQLNAATHPFINSSPGENLQHQEQHKGGYYNEGSHISNFTFCNESKHFTYGINWEHECTLVVNNLEEACKQQLNIHQFTDYLIILENNFKSNKKRQNRNIR
jgi:hypothetical protein